MPRAARKYTMKEARAYTGASVNQSLLAQARKKDLGYYVRHVSKLNGQEPALPAGVEADSEEGIKLWKRAYQKALNANALEGWAKRNPEKNALLNEPAPTNSPRHPAAPARHRTLAERRDSATKARPGVAVTAAAPSTIDERTVMKSTSAKRPIDEVDADDNQMSPKRRRQDVAIVKPGSDQENRQSSKNSASGPPTASSSSLNQNNSTATTENGRKIAVLKKPSTKLQESNIAHSERGSPGPKPRPALRQKDSNRLMTSGSAPGISRYEFLRQQFSGQPMKTLPPLQVVRKPDTSPPRRKRVLRPSTMRTSAEAFKAYDLGNLSS